MWNNLVYCVSSDKFTTACLMIKTRHRNEREKIGNVLFLTARPHLRISIGNRWAGDKPWGHLIVNIWLNWRCAVQTEPRQSSAQWWRLFYWIRWIIGTIALLVSWRRTNEPPTMLCSPIISSFLSRVDKRTTVTTVTTVLYVSDGRLWMDFYTYHMHWQWQHTFSQTDEVIEAKVTEFKMQLYIFFIVRSELNLCCNGK